MYKILLRIKKIVIKIMVRTKYILNHPLTKGHFTYFIKRYLIFQLIGRLYPGLFLYPYIGNIFYVARPGIGGIVGNVYTGLHDFEEMAFLLHFLREGDLFVDVGANVGAYTLLASGICKAKTIAIEPIPSTVDMLLLNLRINDLLDSVNVVNCGAGSKSTELSFTKNNDVSNMVILHPSEDDERLIKVKVNKLDDILNKKNPNLIKIDTEGFEWEILKGMENTLEKSSLKAIIVSIEHVDRYGQKSDDIFNMMESKGFVPIVYDPFGRQIIRREQCDVESDKIIYIRNEEIIKKRINLSPKYQVLNKSF